MRGYLAALMSRIPQPVRRFVGRCYAPLERWWLGLEDLERKHAYVLALLIIGSVAHFLCYTVYYIEDAGISFAYARNFVDGEGWVPFPGGERVEGFSNPLWTWLVALWYAVGVPPWTSSKIMGAVFGSACLPLSYLITRWCRPGVRDHVALIPPALLAASATSAIWNASGLENSLFGFLLAGGTYQIMRERVDGFPWSAVWLLGLSITRPEGIAYAAIGGFFVLLRAIQMGKWMHVLRWVVVFWAPFLVYHAWRYWYFAWEFPNTYYAKLDGENRFQPWRWRSRGWKYINNYMRAYGLAFSLPLFAVAMVGLKDARRWLVVLGTAIGATLLLWNGQDGIPADFDPDWLAYLQKHWDKTRVIFVITSVVTYAAFTTRRGASRRLGLGLMGGGLIVSAIFGGWSDALFMGTCVIGGGLIFLAAFANTAPSAIARNLVLGMAGTGIFFVLYSGGDWMKQWRFFSYFLVPLYVLMGLGLGRLILALPGRWFRGGWASLLLTLTLAPNLWNSIHAAPAPETSVSNVYTRVKYMQWVQRRLHLERVTLWDVDMGAHMYYSGWRIKDIAGLIDVPVARRLYQKAFIQEYVFQEDPPEFAHMHGGWAGKVKWSSHLESRSDYVEIPGYPSGRKAFHVGNHVRKALFVLDEYLGPPERRVRLGGGITFEGVALPSPEVPRGGKLYLEYWMKAGFRKEDFRVFAILEGEGGRHLASLPPGYDWYWPEEWKSKEHIRNRYDFDLPADLPEGDYRLGFLVLDGKSGKVLAPMGEEISGSKDIEGAFFFDDLTVSIVPREVATEHFDSQREASWEHFAQGRCEDGWAAWEKARYHVWKNRNLVEEWRPQAWEQMAMCYATRAESAPDREARIGFLVTAMSWDHRPDIVTEQARPLAKELDAEGDLARSEGDIEVAYELYRTALKLDPRLSWTRRKAEEVRDERLGIEGKVRDSARQTPEKPPKLEKEDEAEKKDEAEKEDRAETPEMPKKPEKLRLVEEGRLPTKHELQKTPETPETPEMPKNPETPLAPD